MVLIIYADTGNEDGPSIMTFVTYYENVKNLIGKYPSKTYYVGINDIDVFPGYIRIDERSGNDLSSYFTKYNVVDIIEVNDHYDYFDENALAVVQQKELNYNPQYSNIIPLSNRNSIALLTIITYNNGTPKYLIPTEEYHKLKPYFGIFENPPDDDMRKINILHKILNAMEQYRVNMSYYDIFTNYNNFTDVDFLLFDTCCDELIDDILT